MVAGEDGHNTVGAALRYQHSQDGGAVGLPREQSPGDAEDRYQGNEGEPTPKRTKVPDEYPPGFITIRFV